MERFNDMHVVSKPTVSHYFRKKNLGFPDTHVMCGRERNKQMFSCIRNLNPRTRVNQDQEINPKTVPLGHGDKERDSIFSSMPLLVVLVHCPFPPHTLSLWMVCVRSPAVPAVPRHRPARQSGTCPTSAPGGPAPSSSA